MFVVRWRLSQLDGFLEVGPIPVHWKGSHGRVPMVAVPCKAHLGRSTVWLSWKAPQVLVAWRLYPGDEPLVGVPWR